MSLSPRQKRHLRGLTHALQPVVIVGDKGLTEAVMAEIELALDHHELVKIRLRSDRETRTAWADKIGDATGAAFYIFQVVGDHFELVKKVEME